MGMNELIKEIFALPMAEQREIFELLRARMGVEEAGDGAAGPKKRKDPWGTVYQELTKTFRRPATP
jgi:hypothetical protein